MKVLKTNDTWYGMTYHEDVAAVKDSFKKMLANGVYFVDSIVSFFVSVVAGIVTYYICKWLDSKH